MTIWWETIRDENDRPVHLATIDGRGYRVTQGRRGRWNVQYRARGKWEWARRGAPIGGPYCVRSWKTSDTACAAAESGSCAPRNAHTSGGNCWHKHRTDVCLLHDEPRGECATCPRCTACAPLTQRG